MESILGTNVVTQIGVLCHDIEKTARAYSQFLGQDYEVCETAPYESSRTTFMGEASEARTKQAFFKIGDNLEIELLEPDDEPSTWRHELNVNGEGAHHIAFWIKDMDDKIAKLGAAGMPLLQRGQWDTGRYAYVDARKQLKTVVELLEDTSKGADIQ